MKKKDYEKFRIGCDLIAESGADFILVGDAGEGKCFEAGRAEDISGDLLFTACCEYVAGRLKDCGESKFHALLNMQMLVNHGIHMAYGKDDEDTVPRN